MERLHARDADRKRTIRQSRRAIPRQSESAAGPFPTQPRGAPSVCALLLALRRPALDDVVGEPARQFLEVIKLGRIGSDPLGQRT